ncbi:SDR family NAD(P)-dependent oxidoreductase, partial [Enterobacter hormaechei]|nr:SDR family NAD(P)-dependent oxidoreductase [Enterobacter hormaechei]
MMFNEVNGSSALQGKRVVVTGGGRDFGQAVSVWLAREGAQVDLCARQLAGAEATCEIIRREGGIARSYQCDMSDAQSVSDFATQLL